MTKADVCLIWTHKGKKKGRKKVKLGKPCSFTDNFGKKDCTYNSLRGSPSLPVEEGESPNLRATAKWRNIWLVIVVRMMEVKKSGAKLTKFISFCSYFCSNICWNLSNVGKRRVYESLVEVLLSDLCSQSFRCSNKKNKLITNCPRLKDT